MTYKITDYNGEEIQGSFYEQELQNTAQGTFRIEKILKRQGDKCLVKWMGYRKSFSSWIDTKTIVKLQKNLPRDRIITVEKKTIFKTCFNKHDKISFNIYW